MNKKSYRRVVLFCFIFAALVFVATIILLPYFQKLSEPENQAAIENWINQKGGAGVLIILAVQIMQVVIAFIPGEPVELLAGALYGIVGGLVVKPFHRHLNGCTMHLMICAKAKMKTN
ncbi:putative membrane protein YdjX (TVP38/TMEM64 family) [Lachnospiraceae bacterium PF1-22]|uniref:hypothetical protein n=1 Tax=Ohessyouella blattaphilus TaxID=2949333 RepID=UPI003E32451F